MKNYNERAKVSMRGNVREYFVNLWERGKCGTMKKKCIYKRKKIERERERSNLNGPRGPLFRLRLKSARLETRDARPVVSDNRLLFFRGQMLVQKLILEPDVMGTGSTCQVCQPPEGWKDAARVSLHRRIIIVLSESDGRKKNYLNKSFSIARRPKKPKKGIKQFLL